MIYSKQNYATYPQHKHVTYPQHKRLNTPWESDCSGGHSGLGQVVPAVGHVGGNGEAGRQGYTQGWSAPAMFGLGKIVWWSMRKVSPNVGLREICHLLLVCV